MNNELQKIVALQKQHHQGPFSQTENLLIQVKFKVLYCYIG